MKYLLIPAVLVVFAGFYFAITGDSSQNETNQPTTNNQDNVTVQKIAKEIVSGEAYLYDVRTTVEYDLEHAAGALNHNVEKIKSGDLPPVDKEDKVYLYCRSGNRSAQAKSVLESLGYTNVIDLGALQSWKDAGGSTEQTELGSYLDILEELGKEPIEPLGDKNADVVVVKYSDFACPYCAKFVVETEPRIRKKFVTENSNVRYEYRNYTYLGDESALTASGGYCANEQGLFWDYHDAISAGFAQTGPEHYTLSNLSIVVEQAGGSADEFVSCIESEVYDVVVSAETLGVKKEGISSTPTVSVNGQLIQGALPFSAFDTVIEAYLAIE